MNSTQDMDSLQQTRICFESIKSDALICSTTKISMLSPVVKNESILLPMVKEESLLKPVMKKETRSPPVVKRKKEKSTHPTKRIKFNRPNYDFLDTQGQMITPFSNTKLSENLPEGSVSKMFADFLSRRPSEQALGTVIDSKTLYGIRLLTVSILSSNQFDIKGIVNVIYGNHLAAGTKITLIGSKLVDLDGYSYLLPKEIIPC